MSLIYQLTFSDGATYIGMTNRSLEDCLAYKTANPTDMTILGRKLQTGMGYTSQTLCKPLGGVLMYEVWVAITQARKPSLNPPEGCKPISGISYAMRNYNPMNYISTVDIVNAIKSGGYRV